MLFTTSIHLNSMSRWLADFCLIKVAGEWVAVRCPHKLKSIHEERWAYIDKSQWAVLINPSPWKLTLILGALAQWYWKLLSAIQLYTLKCSSLCELLLKIRNFTDFLHPPCRVNVCRETCMEMHYNIDDHRALVLDCGSCHFPLNNWGFDSYTVLLNSLLQL